MVTIMLLSKIFFAYVHWLNNHPTPYLLTLYGSYPMSRTYFLNWATAISSGGIEFGNLWGRSRICLLTSPRTFVLSSARIRGFTFSKRNVPTEFMIPWKIEPMKPKFWKFIWIVYEKKLSKNWVIWKLAFENIDADIMKFPVCMSGSYRQNTLTRLEFHG